MCGYLPIALLEKFVELSSLQETAELQKVAVGIDIRNGQALEEMRDVLARIKKKQVHYEILFLDAEDSVLVKRYKETRRNHPLSGGDRVDKGIEEERKRLAFFKRERGLYYRYQPTSDQRAEAELDKIFVQNQTIRICLLRFCRLDLSTGSRRTPIWSLTCVSCRIRIMWRDCGQRRAMTRRSRIMCSSMRRHICFWTSSRIC